MRRSALPVMVLAAAATLGGCSEGVLNPQGPVAAAELQILLNAVAIMLAIVIPTIIAVLAVGFWSRAPIRAHATCRTSIIPAVSRCLSGRSRR